MRIEGIRIDGFGRFHERRLMPLAPGMNVFVGPNEAGKSTLLAFIQTVLYGFPRQKRAEFYPPLDGGQHGGRLWIADERGAHYIVARHAASPAKDLTITLPDHSETTSEDVLRQLLAGASRDVFTSVFSFGIAELQAIDSLSGGEVGSQIYSAGIGAGAVPGALAALLRQEEELFRKRGQKHRVADIARELDDVEGLLSDRHEDDARYAALERDRTAALGQAEQLAAEHAELQRSASRAQRLRDAWPAWASAERLRRQIASLGNATVQPGAIAKLEAIEAALANDESERDQERLRAEQGVRAALAITVDHAVLEAAPQIERLRAGWDAHAASLRDLPKRAVELEVARRALDDALAEMGAAWDGDTAARIDTSNAMRVAIEELQEGMAQVRRELDRRDDRLEVARERYDTRRSEHRSAAADLQATGSTRPVSECEEALRLVQACAHAQSGIPVGGDGSAGLARAVGTAIGLLVGAIPGLLLAGPLGGLFGGGLGAIAGLTLASRRSNPERAAAVAAFHRALQLAGIEEAELTAAIRRAEEDLRRAQDRARMIRAEQEAAAQLADADSALGRAGGDRDDAATSLERLESDWQELAAAIGLPPGTTPALAMHLIAQARVVTERARVVADLQHRVGAIERDIERYDALVSEAGAACRRDPGPGGGDSSAAAGDLVARLDEAKTSERARREAVARADASQSHLEECERRFQHQRAALATWLETNGAADAPDLRRRTAITEARETLNRELRECEIRLAEAGGGGAELDRFAADLQAADPDYLQAAMTERAGALQEVSAARDRLLEQRGSIERGLRDLRAGEGTSSLLLKRERLRAELASVLQRWSEIRLARRLIERTRGIYEAERQPRVVKAAEEYFKAMTGGRYTRVIAPLGEQTLRVGNDTHAPKSPDQLSRGTREQLYLALRFGLIDQFAERGGPLPVAVDEVLVNFDPERALEAARGFARLSKRHQVIAFTCHPWVVDLLRTAEPNARIWQLSVGDEAAEAQPLPASLAR